MYSTPFHRRILPWVFAIILLIMAPAVIFYTSGYRWNPKKGVIERNGTLIIDTIPSGATISLNGREQAEKTPVTLQNVSPGTYAISLSKDGYHTWSKSLSIDPERVTFATGINLWPVSEPEPFAQGQAQSLITDSRSQRLMILYQSPSSSRLVLQDTDTKSVLADIAIPEKIAISSSVWDYSSNQALLFAQAAGAPGTWLVELADARATKLPQGIYHWDQSKITGFSGNDQITIDQKSAVEKTSREKDVWDQMDGYKLVRLPNAANLVLVAKNKEKEGTLLPPGNWTFISANSESIVLKDLDNWIWINTSGGKTFSSQAPGQWLYGITVKRIIKYVFKNNNEVWVWDQGENPSLIYRQTDPIIQVAWHSDGNDIMVATQKDIRMYNLDDRNGRFETILAVFDSINDATIVNDSIFVAGTKNNASGVWRIPLSLPKTPGSLLNGLKF